MNLHPLNKKLFALLTLGLLNFFMLSEQAQAYDVCSDPGAPCTHEVMTKQGLDLYLLTETIPSGLRAELNENWGFIKEGVAAPDEGDPVYGNSGIAGGLTTITHFWDPDTSLDSPMAFSVNAGYVELNLLPDDYPNAFGTAKGLWMRALGEYSTGNKAKAYRYLGMVAHFLGDQTIPTHVHGDTHGPDAYDDDAYEEWMSVVGTASAECLANNGADGTSVLHCEESPHAVLTLAEYQGLNQLGIHPVPNHDIDMQLLWVFLSTNQVADYFASDNANGDANHPKDDKYPYVEEIYPSNPGVGLAQPAIDRVIAGCAADFVAATDVTPEISCPTNQFKLFNNDGYDITAEQQGQLEDLAIAGGNGDLSFSDIIEIVSISAERHDNNDNDGDLSLIRKHSYIPGIRSIGSLFAIWQRAISNPIMTVSVYGFEETGSRALQGTVFEGFLEGTIFENTILDDGLKLIDDVVLGLDDLNKPDYYTGVTISSNQRHPHKSPASYLENRDGQTKIVNGLPYPTNVTRADAFKPDIAENKKNWFVENNGKWTPHYHFGQSFNYPNGVSFESEVDTLSVNINVFDQDDNLLAAPYSNDDSALIFPYESTSDNIPRENISLLVDLANCAAKNGSGLYFNNDFARSIKCGERHRVGGGLLSPGGNDRDVDIIFGVKVSEPFYDINTGVALGDTVPPEISCEYDSNEWYQDDATIYCTAFDAYSGLQTISDSSFNLTTSVGFGTQSESVITSSKEICDRQGNCSTAGPYTVKIDKKVPELVSCATASSNWLSSNTGLTCNASDSGAGFQNFTDTSTTTTIDIGPFGVELEVIVNERIYDTNESKVLATSVPEGEETSNAFTVSKKICDRLGNCLTLAPIGGNKIDKKAPEYSCDGIPNYSGDDVNINCAANDGGSGLISSDDASFVLALTTEEGTETTNASASKEICDNVGNCVTAERSGVIIDKKSPVVSCGTADGEWHNTDVDINCTVVDEGIAFWTILWEIGASIPNGSFKESGESFVASTNVAPNTETDNALTTQERVCDPLENCYTPTQIGGNKIDKKAPVFICKPFDTTKVYSSDVTISCKVKDGGSGLKLSTDAFFELSTNVVLGTNTERASTNAKEICDNVDNCVIAQINGIKIDKRNVDENKAPTILFQVEQNLKNTLLVNQIDGLVVVTANVSDPNQNDVHSFSWAVSNRKMIDLDNADQTFTFDPALISSGVYSLTVVVKDSSNLSSKSTVKLYVASRVLKSSNTKGSKGNVIPSFKANTTQPKKVLPLPKGKK